MTLCYLPQAYFLAFKKGEERSISSEVMMFAIAQLLHELATNIQPLDGVDPILDSTEFARLSERLRSLCVGLLHGGWDGIESSVQRFFAKTETLVR